MFSQQAMLTLNYSKLKLYVLQDKNRRLVLREYTNSTSNTRIADITFLPSWETTWHWFYPINAKARAKMADIVNKVY